MPKNDSCPPLGTLLQQADLVSASQIEIALQDQKQYQYRIGEILALHGWLKQETADFFAQEWLKLLQQPDKQRLGEYLLSAGLLDRGQVQNILFLQRKTSIRFGALAVLKSWVKPTTLNFFLTSLFYNCGDASLEVSDILRYILATRKITRQQHNDLVTLMSKEESLTPSELASIGEICHRLNRGDLEVVD